MLLHKIVMPGLAIHTYIIADQKGCAVIDPPRSLDPVIAFLNKSQFKLTHILETHVHADFVCGSKELKHRYGNDITICCSGMGGPEWIPHYADQVIRHKDVLRVGGMQLQAWHVPGHTPEHVMWLLLDGDKPIKAFTGDFLLMGSVGRPDLLGNQAVKELAHRLYESVFNVLPQLPDELEVYPAHGAGSLCGKAISKEENTTLGKQRAVNPALVYKEEKTWIEGLLKDMPKAPTYFSLMKHLNVIGAPLLINLAPPLPLQAEEAMKLPQGDVFMLDVRPTEAFAEGHLPGAVHIPLGDTFARWAAQLIPYDMPIVLLFGGEDPRKVIEALRLVGLDRITHIVSLKGVSMEEKIPWVTPQEAEKLQILDVRSIGEWDTGHLPHAVHVELGQLPQELGKLDKSLPWAVICGSGNRASIGASLLKKAGFTKVCSVKGGMRALRPDILVYTKTNS